MENSIENFREQMEYGGLIVGSFLSIGLQTFNVSGFFIDTELVIAAVATILITSLIGIIDDLLLLSQRVKAFLPLFAAMPLVAMRAGVTFMDLPFIGRVEFGILYPILIIPLAITGASNATNMLAGFNGLEAGLGIIMCASVALISYSVASLEATVVSLSMLGALLAFLRYNWSPAKILIGDVGTLSIGAVVATSVIIGDIERAGAILMVPFFFELVLKARGRFKEQSWCDVKEGLLICPDKSRIFGLGRLVMYLTGGVRETSLVLYILAFEAFFGFWAVYSYLGNPLI